LPETVVEPPADVPARGVFLYRAPRRREDRQLVVRISLVERRHVQQVGFHLEEGDAREERPVEVPGLWGPWGPWGVGHVDAEGPPRLAVSRQLGRRRARPIEIERVRARDVGRPADVARAVRV